MTSLPIEDARELESRKICWNLLAPSLQSRFNDIQAKIDQNSTMITINKGHIADNWINTLKNTEDIKNLRKYIDDLISKIEKEILKYLDLPPGVGSGIGYAYEHGEYGHLLKVDNKFQRLFSNADYQHIDYLFKPGDTPQSLIQKGLNFETSYDPINGIYYNPVYSVRYTIHDPAANSDTNYLPVTFSRTFIYETHTGRFYFFYSPTKFVRIM